MRPASPTCWNAEEDLDEADRIFRVAFGTFQSVTMHRPNEPGYSTSDSYVIDDWR
jgi:hypothetical protein